MGYGCVEDAVNTMEYAVSIEYGVCVTGLRRPMSMSTPTSAGVMFGTLEKRPSFEAYLDRISNRPAAVRAREIDDALAVEEQARAAS